MQKQIEKNINKISKFGSKKEKFVKRKSRTQIKRKRTLSRRALKNFGISSYISKSRASLKVSRYCYYTFQIYQNNIFCTLKILKNSKVHLLSSVSSGKYNIKISRKTLKQRLKFVIASFLKETKIKKKKLNLPSFVAVKITAPTRLKTILIKLLRAHLKKKLSIIEVNRKYIFNGCRARKKVRKKRKGLRLFK